MTELEEKQDVAVALDEANEDEEDGAGAATTWEVKDGQLFLSDTFQDNLSLNVSDNQSWCPAMMYENTNLLEEIQGASPDPDDEALFSEAQLNPAPEDDAPSYWWIPPWIFDRALSCVAGKKSNGCHSTFFLLL